MSAFDKMFGEDRVYSAIQTHLRGTKRSGDKIKFNCPMCTTRGETPDKRMRGALWHDANGTGIKCFNCAFVTKFKLGDPLSKNMKAFLSQIGVGDYEITKLNYWAFQLHKLTENSTTLRETIISRPLFQGKSLPEEARSVDAWAKDNWDDPDFLDAIQYLYSRGDEIAEAVTYYWTPNKKYNLNRRIIVPCYYQGSLVGWSARAISKDVTPKYHKETPPNFLFNSDALDHPDREYVIIVEGLFDALALDCLGLLGAELNEKQAAWINDSDKKKIVLPDRDKAGGRLINYALQYDWEVSFPRPLSIGADRGWWSSEIKDAAQAVEKYGRLYTLRSVFESATDNHMKISMQKKVFQS